MRVLAVLTLSAAALWMPQLAAADPAQPDAAATPSQATATAAPQQVAQTPSPAADASDNEIVCKSTPPPTGSRLGGGRECHTAKEWNDRMKDSQDILKRTQMAGHEGALAGPGGK